MSKSANRARVMGRSRKLGHCICDPRKKCPCDVFLEEDVCRCAGERLEDAAPVAEAVGLTKLVKNAGCASKIPPVDLARVLSRLPAVTDPRVLVGSRTADDAGVFQVSPDLCLVQTVDVFAPCVDDPYEFGQVAACNSLSDVYAMGGTPVAALSIIGYPIRTLNDEWMCLMLRGGMDKLEEAGVALVGGHSINDEEIKFGFAVTGTIDPNAIITNAGARPGDALILTKGIGTGIISFAAQMDRACEDSIRASAASMTTLNKAASEAMLRVGADACTDVTGFGLLGHLYHVVRESGVTAEVWWDAVPVLPGVLDYAKRGIVSGAAERNREFASGIVKADKGVPDHALDVLYDAQTSGGLLIAIPEKVVDETLNKLHGAGCGDAAWIGRVVNESEGKIMVKKQGSKSKADRKPCCDAKPAAEQCCASDGPGAGDGSASEAFQQFVAKAFGPGAIDVVQKELMTIALSVAVQCEACLKIHLEKARGMAVSPEEIEEAAWMGVVFGGCRSMMFWQEKSRDI